MPHQNTFKIKKLWWDQFPIQLRLITKIRFFGSFGAGGVIYLTSLIFNNIGISATAIGLGFTISAILGTITRVITGNYLNKKNNIQLLLLISSSLGIIASLVLIIADNKILYIIGQSFIGSAAGIYWPTVEFAVPYLSHSINTKKSYALVRSSEALGIFLGVLTGSFLNSFFYFKSIYFVDIFCLLMIIYLTSNKKNQIYIFFNAQIKQSKTILDNNKEIWNINTKIILTSIILITTCLALIQVTLPLDFVKGGLYRNPISSEITSYVISSQLIFLFLLQWPIGSWLANKGNLFGLKLSLTTFSISSMLLFASSYSNLFGFYFMIIAIIFFGLGTASFLPSSTDIVFKIAPPNKKGFAFAILSQCFALGYLFGPSISGKILDQYGNASLIWLGISILSFSNLYLIFKKKL